MKTNTCILCDIIGNKNNLQAKPVNTILYENENFVVLPAKGTMLDGYLMICPKKHYTGMANLPYDVRQELFVLIEKIKQIILKEYKIMPTILEHGSLREGRHPKSIVHAHVHIFPFNFNKVHHQKMLDCLKLEKIDLKSQMQNFAGKNYWLYVDKNENAYMSHTISNVPRSIFLRLVACQLGMEECYEWREPKNDNIETIKKTLEKLSGPLKNLKI